MARRVPPPPPSSRNSFSEYENSGRGTRQRLWLLRLLYLGLHGLINRAPPWPASDIRDAVQRAIAQGLDCPLADKDAHKPLAHLTEIGMLSQVSSFIIEPGGHTPVQLWGLVDPFPTVEQIRINTRAAAARKRHQRMMEALAEEYLGAQLRELEHELESYRRNRRTRRSDALTDISLRVATLSDLCSGNELPEHVINAIEASNAARLHEFSVQQVRVFPADVQNQYQVFYRYRGQLPSISWVDRLGGDFPERRG